MNQALVEAVAENMSASLLGYIKALLQDKSLAEDIFQNVFCKLWKTKISVEEITNLKAFVFKIAKNEIWRELGKKHSRLRIVEDSDIFEAVEEKTSELDAICIEESLLKIPKEQREVIYLKIYGQLTFQEIADTLGTSKSTITSRYRYAIEKMRELLGDTN